MSTINDVKTFENLNFGTKVSTVSQETVYVNVDGRMIRDYAQAYIKESRRLNPEAIAEVNLTLDELTQYFKFLLKCRVQSLSPDGLSIWRRIKQCYIPSFFQFVLSQIGIYVDYSYGLKFIPVYDEEVPKLKSSSDEGSDEGIDYFATSDKIAFFTHYGLAATRDAMPRNVEGDPDTMGFIISGDYVYGRRIDQHPICSYVAAFLGFKLSEDSAFKMLYRVRYDDVEFIKESLIHEEAIYGSRSNI